MQPFRVCFQFFERDQSKEFNRIVRRVAQSFKEPIGHQNRNFMGERSPNKTPIPQRSSALENAAGSGIFPAPSLTVCPSGCSYSHAARLADVLGLALANRAIVCDRLIAVLH